MQVSYFDDVGLFTHSGELPTNPVTGKPFDHNPEVCTLKPLPDFDALTERARWVAEDWMVEAIPQPEPEPEPESEPEPPALEQVKAVLQTRVNSEYTQRMNAVALPYPQYERESWPVQIQEAQALATDPAASTPWIDACSYQRGMDRGELAQRVLSKDAAYRIISGKLTGARQSHEDAIYALTDLNAAQSYDVKRDWPNLE